MRAEETSSVELSRRLSATHLLPMCNDNRSSLTKLESMRQAIESRSYNPTNSTESNVPCF